MTPREKIVPIRMSPEELKALDILRRKYGQSRAGMIRLALAEKGMTLNEKKA